MVANGVGNVDPAHGAHAAVMEPDPGIYLTRGIERYTRTTNVVESLIEVLWTALATRLSV